MTNLELTRTRVWTTPIGRDHAADHALTYSGSGWVLALLPAFYVGFVALTLNAGIVDPIVQALFLSFFYMAGVALAAVDEHVLRASGHRVTASPFLSLLGGVPYLAARTRHVVAATGNGVSVLWTHVGALVVGGAIVAAILTN